MDGYLEVYHHDIVHRATVGAHTVGNLLVHDTYGPHQRMTFARPSLRELAELPPDEWVEPAQHIRLIHSVFPNLSASGIVGGHCLVGIILPIDLHRTVTKQFVLCAPGEQDDAWREAAEAFSDLTLRAVRDEDYALVQTVQEALASGANDDFLLGRNEPAVQHYHEMVQRLTAGTPVDEMEAS